MHDVDLGNGLRGVGRVGPDEPAGAGGDRRRQVHSVDSSQPVGGPERHGEVGGRLVERPEVEAGQQDGQRLALGVVAAAHRLREQLGDQEHRTGPRHHARRLGRYRREERPDPPPARVIRHRGVDEDISVEGVHATRSARRPARRHLVRPPRGQRRGIVEPDGAALRQEIPDALCVGQGAVRPPHPERVRSDHDGNRSPVTGDGDVLARPDPVEDFRQRRSGLAHDIVAMPRVVHRCTNHGISRGTQEEGVRPRRKIR